MNLLRAEFIKFRSTASPWWLLGIALVISAGLAALIGTFFESMATETGGPVGEGDGPWISFMFTQLFSSLPLILVWVVTIVACTGEYRQGTIRSAFSMRPKRWDIYTAKTVFYVIMTAIASAVIIGVAFLILSMTSGVDYFQPWNTTVLATAGRSIVYAVLGVFLVVGLSFLLRNAAGAITLVVAWILVVESLVGVIPKIGNTLSKWMPFMNGQNWSAPTEFVSVLDSPWNIVWFAAVSLAVWLGGLLALVKRDA